MAVLSLYRHFPVINISNWRQVLQDAVLKAQKACLQHNIDPQQLVFFPWLQRSTLDRILIINVAHEGELIDTLLFDWLRKVCRENTVSFNENILNYCNPIVISYAV